NIKIYNKDTYLIPSEKYDENNNRDIYELEKDFYSKLNFYGQLVYLDIGKINDIDLYDEEEDKGGFLKGVHNISWEGLRRDFDVKRESYKQIHLEIYEFLKLRSKAEKIYKYLPGVGGTTCLLRLAYDFHKMYPTFILEQYLDGQTDFLIFELYRKSRLPVLILIDSNSLSKEFVNKLKMALEGHGRNFPYTIVYVERESSISKIKASTFDFLTHSEAKILRDRLIPYIPQKNGERVIEL